MKLLELFISNEFKKFRKLKKKVKILNIKVNSLKKLHTY